WPCASRPRACRHWICSLPAVALVVAGLGSSRHAAWCFPRLASEREPWLLPIAESGAMADARGSDQLAGAVARSSHADSLIASGRSMHIERAFASSPVLLF